MNWGYGTKTYVTRFFNHMTTGRHGMTIALILIGVLTSWPVSGTATTQQPRRLPSIHFDLDPFDAQCASCNCSGQGDLTLQALSARWLSNKTEINARTNLEIELSTDGIDAMIEPLAEVESVVRFSTAGKLQRILPGTQSYIDTFTSWPCGEAISGLLSIDRRVRLRDIEKYLSGAAGGKVTVSISVAHQVHLSALISCPNELPGTVEFGRLKWLRNYAVMGDWDPRAEKLNKAQIVLDPNRPEISNATFEEPEHE
jgi:hypothetical protein